MSQFIDSTPQLTVHVAAHNVVHDVHSMYDDDIQAAVTAATAGDTILIPPIPGGYTITARVTVNKALTIKGDQTLITQTTTNTGGFYVTASGVEITGLHLVGTGYSTYAAGARGLDIAGAQAALLTNISVHHNRIESWAGRGMLLYFVDGFDVSYNRVKNIAFSGISISSSWDGNVGNNRVTNIGEVVLGDGTETYGISISRVQGTDASDTGPSPLSKNIRVHHNYVADIPGWEGLDTHGGQDILFSHNTVKRCKFGLVVGCSTNGSSVNVFPARNVRVVHNLIDYDNDDGMSTHGIAAFGGTVGSTLQTAPDTNEPAYVTGFIKDNIIRYHGWNVNGSDIGAISVWASDGFQVEGNFLYRPANQGIYLSYHNRNISLKNNVIMDPWGDRVSATINAATFDGSFVTYTTSAAHGLTAATASMGEQGYMSARGRVVTVSGSSNTSFNTTRSKVWDIPSATTFRVPYVTEGTGGVTMTPSGTFSGTATVVQGSNYGYGIQINDANNVGTVDGNVVLDGELTGPSNIGSRGINVGNNANTAIELGTFSGGTTPLTDTGFKTTRLSGVYSGTGTPEAAVTAPVGSLYRQTDGGASTTLYVKESGTSNTGWVAK